MEDALRPSQFLYICPESGVIRGAEKYEGSVTSPPSPLRVRRGEGKNAVRGPFAAGDEGLRRQPRSDAMALGRHVKPNDLKTVPRYTPPHTG